MAFTLEEVKETIVDYSAPEVLADERLQFLAEVILAEIEAAVHNVFMERIPN